MTDALNGLMAIPNLIALILLAPVVFQLSREYFAEEAAANLAEENSKPSS
jgi:AGCS family alanine or glycine:cation symporter